MLKIKYAALVSGGGTNLQALIRAQAEEKIPDGELSLVVASRPDAYALTRASETGIPAEVADRAALGSQSAFEARLLALLTQYEIELIVLAGFMQILSAEFVSRFPERIVNVHPSLIPAYCGKGYYGIKVHEAVLANGETETGATVHMVNEIPDGGRILLQQRVRVNENDTPQALQRRVMEQAEWVLLPRAVERLCAELARKKESR